MSGQVHSLIVAKNQGHNMFKTICEGCVCVFGRVCDCVCDCACGCVCDCVCVRQ